MIVERNERVVREFITDWSNLDANKLVEYFTEDGIYHNMPMQPVSGHDNLRKFIAAFLNGWSQTNWDVLTLISKDNIVIAERLDQTIVAGKKVDLPCCGVFEMRDGKIAVWRDYFDMGTYTKAISA